MGAFLTRLMMPFLRKWVAGDKLEDAVRAVKELNEENIEGLMNYLGEHYRKRREVEDAKSEYFRMIDTIRSEGLKASISIKPSQMGFDAGGKEFFIPPKVSSRAYCFNSMRSVVKKAAENGVFVWLDMESKEYVDFTIGAYKKLLDEFGDVGICLQSDIKRTDDDLKEFKEFAKTAKNKPVLRLVKGIYDEEGKSKKEVNERYGNYIMSAFEVPELGVAVASHDDRYVDLALKLNDKNPKKVFEVQMLKGIREDYAGKIASEGTKTTIYVPYGPDAAAYSLRRVKKLGRLIIESRLNVKLTR